MYLIIYKRIKYNNTIIRPVVAGQGGPINYFTIAVAHVNSFGVRFKVIGEDSMTVAIDTKSIGIAKIIAIRQTVIAMPQGKLSPSRIQEGIISICIAAGFIGNQLIFTPTAGKQIMFYQPIAYGHAQAA